jgi:hypothetical protein
MDVKPWRDTLDAMTQPGGWIYRKDAKGDTLVDPKVERARAVLAGYEKTDGWIKHSIPAEIVDRNDGHVEAIEPQASLDAKEQRDSLLQLALFHELKHWDEHQQGQFLLDALIGAVIHAAKTECTGLRAEVSTRAAFFGEDILDKLRGLAARMAPSRDWVVPVRYDPHDEAMIEHWGRAWTTGVALVALDWACNSRQCRSVGDIARTIWHGTAWISFYPQPALVPTKRSTRDAHFELHTRAAVAYTFAGNESIRALVADEPASLPFLLRAFSDSRRVSETKLYDGYRRTHLYLAVWLDCLHAYRTQNMRKYGPSKNGAAGAVAGALETPTPEQRRALAATNGARTRIAALRRAKKGGPVRKGTSQATAATEDWIPISHGSLRPLPVHEVPGNRWQPIASIDLWRELGPEVEWIDLMVVARIEDRQVALPITMEDADSDDTTGHRSLLVLDRDSDVEVDATALRRAFHQADALVGVVVKKSLGAFVVLEIDVNTQQAVTDGG